MKLRRDYAQIRANMCAFAKFWMSVLTDIRNRGTRDVFFLVCDGLKGLPEEILSRPVDEGVSGDLRFA